MKKRTFRGSRTTGRETLPHDRAATALPGLMTMSFSLLVVLTVTVWSAPARAGQVSASKMSVSIQSEYDDPRVLVVNQVDLDPRVQLPAEVTFNIPKGADIGMACEVDLNGGHACKPFKAVDRGDYQSLTFTAAREHKVFLEYYYDAFTAGTPQRSFDFIFRPGFPVKSLTMEVQQPLRSSEFTLKPVLPRTFTSDGFSYRAQDYPNVSVGKPLSVKISYRKTDNSPSLKPKPKSPDYASAAEVPSGGRNKTIFLVVLGVIGGVILLMGGYLIFRPGTVASPAGGGARKAKKGRNNVKFCTSCGAERLSDDRFCAQCGHRQS